MVHGGRANRAALAVFLVLGVVSCAGVPTPACAPGSAEAASFELYFGRAIPGGGEVSEADWAAFLDEVVTPRFPDGFTVVDGLGQYRGADGAIVQEPSKLLLVAAPDPAVARPLIDEVRGFYRERFRQEAVLVVEQASCFGL